MPLLFFVIFAAIRENLKTMSSSINFSKTLRFLEMPLIMGILNVTEDSFYD